MKFDLSKDTDISALKDFISFLQESKKHVEVKILYPDKTLSQLKYLHVLISMVCLKFGYTKEYVKKEIGYCDAFGNTLSFRLLNTQSAYIVTELLKIWSASILKYHLPEPAELGYFEQNVAERTDSKIYINSRIDDR